MSTITLKFFINSLFMINVQINKLEFRMCFSLETVLRSHGRTCKIFNVWPSKNFFKDLARTNPWVFVNSMIFLIYCLLLLALNTFFKAFFKKL